MFLGVFFLGVLVFLGVSVFLIPPLEGLDWEGCCSRLLLSGSTIQVVSVLLCLRTSIEALRLRPSVGNRTNLFLWLVSLQKKTKNPKRLSFFLVKLVD